MSYEEQRLARIKENNKELENLGLITSKTIGKRKAVGKDSCTSTVGKSLEIFNAVYVLLWNS